MLLERVEVVHVGREQRDLDQRCGAEPFHQGRQRGALGAPRSCAGRRGSSTAPPPARRPLGIADAARACVGRRPRCRRRTAGGPVDDRPRPRSRPLCHAAGRRTSRLLDRVVPRRGDEHEPGRAGERRSAVTSSARLAEAGLHPGERLEEGDGVGEHVGPDDPADRPQDGWAATLRTCSPPRVGSISSLNSGWSRKRASTPGASRKSSALRLGGVSTTTRSNRSSPCSCVQRLGCHVLLGPAQRAGDVAVEAVVEDPLGLLGARRRCAGRARRTSPRCRASSPTARP